jgi:hypothetical protein
MRIECRAPRILIGRPLKKELTHIKNLSPYMAEWLGLLIYELLLIQHHKGSMTSDDIKNDMQRDSAKNFEIWIWYSFSGAVGTSSDIAFKIEFCGRK